MLVVLFVMFCAAAVATLTGDAVFDTVIGASIDGGTVCDAVVGSLVVVVDTGGDAIGAVGAVGALCS